ncbi:MAG: peptide chain release factor N(5)-glutamine methyltransferase [Candidatus Dormibacteraceae bacterium]
MGLSLLEVLRRATSYLSTHGSSSPRLDAELLLAYALGCRRLDLYLQFDRSLEDQELARYRDLTGRRAKAEPVAYLVGSKEFMKLDFGVSADVLVPNPDTEVLVQRAVSRARQCGRPVRVADVGTGSGCIAVSIAHYVPESTVFASDDSPEALAVAAQNVSRHGLEDRVSLLLGNLLQPHPSDLDLVLANLPYLPRSASLPAEVLAQPAHALFGGESGAELVAALLSTAGAHLAAGGRVLTEIDGGILDQLDLSGFAGHQVHGDLSGRPRVLEAWI